MLSQPIIRLKNLNSKLNRIELSKIGVKNINRNGNNIQRDLNLIKKIQLPIVEKDIFIL